MVLTGATTWSKCAFILTLWGVTNSRGAKLFLVFLMISSHLLLVVSGLGIYAPACGDPKIPLRPYWAGSCLDETAVRSMFLLPIGKTMLRMKSSALLQCLWANVFDKSLWRYYGCCVITISVDDCSKSPTSEPRATRCSYCYGLRGNVRIFSDKLLYKNLFAKMNGLSTGVIVILRSVLQFKKLVGRFGKHLALALVHQNFDISNDLMGSRKLLQILLHFFRYSTLSSQRSQSFSRRSLFFGFSTKRLGASKADIICNRFLRIKHLNRG